MTHFWLTNRLDLCSNLQPKTVDAGRAADQKAVDQGLLTAIKKVPFLTDLLASTFSLRNGDRPHEMVF